LIAYRFGGGGEFVGIWENCKRPVRHKLKQGKALLRGYPFYYTQTQDPNHTHRYPYLWSEFSTPIPERGNPEIRANRLWNLQLAAKRIHCLRLAPREIFSFCNRVGEPTLANGFREAPVFVRGKVLTDAGGGLCLIATNLFNTFLQSGCEILERHCHSIDAYGDKRFYPLGQDASVAYGYKDLVIRNSSQTALQLRFQIFSDRGEVLSSLWGEQPRLVQVKIESRVLKEISPEKADDCSGWIVETTRSVQKTAAHSTQWQLDYRAISNYAPCERS
jgi:vancomycin resistance protein VanW